MVEVKNLHRGKTWDYFAELHSWAALLRRSTGF